MSPQASIVAANAEPPKANRFPLMLTGTKRFYQAPQAVSRPAGRYDLRHDNRGAAPGAAHRAARVRLQRPRPGRARAVASPAIRGREHGLDRRRAGGAFRPDEGDLE